jgi:hypothetical protein
MGQLPRFQLSCTASQPLTFLALFVAETAMPGFDPEKFMHEPIYAFNFQFMIGDVEDFLDFSENNIEWQYRREFQDIQRRSVKEDFPPGYKEHLERNAEHRFKVSLPLRVRYGAVLALTTSVEWSVGFLEDRLKNRLSATPSNMNKTVHALRELDQRTSLGKFEVIKDYESIVQIRNCIAHSAGIEKHYKFRRKLPAAVGRLGGSSLGNWHFFGKHICIDKGALNPYIEAMANLLVTLHKACYEQEILRDNT